jgi:hypothetical protein
MVHISTLPRMLSHPLFFKRQFIFSNFQIGELVSFIEASRCVDCVNLGKYYSSFEGILIIKIVYPLLTFMILNAL